MKPNNMLQRSLCIDTPRCQNAPQTIRQSLFRSRPRLLSWLAAGLIGAGSVAALHAQSINTARLLDDMTNLAGLAEFPNPAYTCKQFSSYDPKSKTSGNEDWFANGDCGQYLRAEDNGGRKEYVMMDIDGPGTVTRIWSANPKGNLRIYLDGAAEPALVASMEELLGGKFPGLPKPISGEYSKGWNLYFPIPYSKHCKITSDANDFYYHVNYRTYPSGTSVETFKLAQLKELSGPIDKLRARLDAPKGDGIEGDLQPFELQVPGGESVKQEFYGPKAFASSVLRVSAANMETALRGVIVKITFDGELCVEAPLGDLFGSAPGINPYATLPLGMSKEGDMYCHWLMPFKDNATIELVNTTKDTVSLVGQMVLQDYQWKSTSMHFHAKWRVQWDVPTRPMIDWNYLAATGKGVFAGVSFSIDNPRKDWWGEGDEKIYVDGETFPSHFGTGTEDYYGYAWCWPGLFTHAYHAQPRCDGPGNYGRTSVNRFHIIDRIPFTKSFKFDMELWHWNDKCNVNMAVVAYWYAQPGATDGFKPIASADAIVRPMPEYVVPRVQGAIEAEEMKILRVAGTAEAQDWDGDSAGKHLWWHAGMKPGDTLALAFNAPSKGKFHVYAHFLSAPDYGIHQFAINGKKLGEPMDFYRENVKPGEEVELGVVELNAGQNEFSSTIVGANPKAIKAYMLGLDYLRLKAAQ